MPRGREARHVGADLADDALRAAVLDAGHRAQQFNRRRERADVFLDHAGEPFDLLVEEIDVAQDRADPQPVMGVEVSGERLAQGGDLLAHLPPRQFGETAGSVSPATSASSMSRPEVPMMSAATVSSLMPASSSALWSRLTSRARSWICVLRYRVRLRSSRIGLGGTKLAFNSPASASRHSHAASETSVLRPGTCLT